jgi:hypothetical protein
MYLRLLAWMLPVLLERSLYPQPGYSHSQDCLGAMEDRWLKGQMLLFLYYYYYLNPLFYMCCYLLIEKT